MSSKQADKRLVIFFILNVLSPIVLFVGVFIGFKLRLDPYIFAGFLTGLIMAVGSIRLKRIGLTSGYDIILTHITPLVYTPFLELFFSRAGNLLLLNVLPLSIVGWLTGFALPVTTQKYQKLLLAFTIVIVASLAGSYVDQTLSSIKGRRVEVNYPKTLSVSFINSFEPLNNEAKRLVHNTDQSIRVIECWATWCKPCLQLMPTFGELQKYYQGNKAVSFMAVDMGDAERETADHVKKFIDRKDYSFPILYNENSSLLDSINSSYLPCTIILKQDTIIKLLIGNDGIEHYRNSVLNTVDSLIMEIEPTELP